MRAGFCPKCKKQLPNLTRHHVWPKRFFGKGANKPTILICRLCHDELEKLIPFKPKLPKKQYWKILNAFLEA